MWVNRTAVQAASNGTTSHTVSFTAATAGNLLVATMYGGVTSSTPTGWTLNTNCSAVSAGGLYVWTKTAAASESSFTTTHNGSNYPVVCVVYEFAAGTTFVNAAADPNATQGSAALALSALDGTSHFLFAVAGNDRAPGTGSATSVATWGGTNAPTKDADFSILATGSVDGYGFSTAYLDGSTITSWSPTVTFTNPIATHNEKILLALAPPTGGGSGTLALTGTGTLALSGSGTRASSGTLALTGTGTLALSGIRIGSDSLALTGTGTLTLAGAAGSAGALALSGTGSLLLSGSGASSDGVGSLAFSGGGSLDVGGSGDGVTVIFRPPVYQRRMPIMPGLAALINYSVALLRINGQWVETEFPSEQQINAADLYFPGGYENEIDLATAALLTNAGYIGGPTSGGGAPNTVGAARVGVTHAS